MKNPFRQRSPEEKAAAAELTEIMRSQSAARRAPIDRGWRGATIIESSIGGSLYSEHFSARAFAASLESGQAADQAREAERIAQALRQDSSELPEEYDVSQTVEIDELLVNEVRVGRFSGRVTVRQLCEDGEEQISLFVSGLAGGEPFEYARPGEFKSEPNKGITWKSETLAAIATHLEPGDPEGTL